MDFSSQGTKAVRDQRYRKVRAGTRVTIFTIGYEKRSGEDLISVLKHAGVEVLADIGEKPMSRKPDFRAGALRASCEEAGIVYEGWPILGSMEAQRSKLQSTGDVKSFEKDFRNYAKSSLRAHLNKLAALVKKRSVALLCYERCHEECHRSIVADLIATGLNATVMALT